MTNLARKHSCRDEGFTLHVNALRNADPTKTTGIRKRFAAEAARRFRRIQKDVRTSIVTNDALDLVPRKPFVLTALPKKAFRFRTSAGKVEGFMEWLEREVNVEILEGQARERVGSLAWANTYIDTSYKQGIRRANQELVKGKHVEKDLADTERFEIEAAFNRPIHADRVGLIYTRVFHGLKGITEAMDTAISRILADGIASGLGPAVIARNINERIEKIGIVRARVLARTEVIRAHHVATINAYREAGIEGVKVKAEWATAGDDRVCPDCADLDGQIFTLDAIEGLIPLHPQCRCVALPADVGEKIAKLPTQEEVLAEIGDQYPTKEGFVVRRGFFEEKTGKPSPGPLPKGKKLKVPSKEK